MSSEHWRTILAGLPAALEARRAESKLREELDIATELKRKERERFAQERRDEEKRRLQVYEQELLENFQKPVIVLSEMFADIADNLQDIHAAKKRKIEIIDGKAKYKDKVNGKDYPQFRHVVLSWGEQLPGKKKSFSSGGYFPLSYLVREGSELPPKKHAIIKNGLEYKLKKGRLLEDYSCIGARFNFENGVLYITPQDFDTDSEWSDGRMAIKDRKLGQCSSSPSELGFEVNISDFISNPKSILPGLTEVLADALSHRYDYRRHSLLYFRP